jgi:hypothetical protein
VRDDDPDRVPRELAREWCISATLCTVKADAIETADDLFDDEQLDLPALRERYHRLRRRFLELLCGSDEI